MVMLEMDGVNMVEREDPVECLRRTDKALQSLTVLGGRKEG